MVLPINTCLNCGKKFQVKDKYHPFQKYCSKSCSVKANREQYKIKKRKNPNMWGTIKYCLLCNKRIIFDKNKPINTEIIRKFCSSDCRNKYANKRAKDRLKEQWQEMSLDDRKIKRRNKFLKSTNIY